MSEFSEGASSGPLPEDRDLTPEMIDAAPQVQEGDRIMQRAKKRTERDPRLPELTPEEREALREIKPEEVPNIVQSSIERAEAVIKGLREEAKANPKDDAWPIKLEKANLVLFEMKKAQKLLQEESAGRSAAEFRQLANFVITKKENLENLWHPPEPPPPSRVFDVAEAPSIMRDSVTHAEEVTREIEKEIRAHPTDSMLVKKLEIAHQHLDRIKTMYGQFIGRGGQGLSDQEVRRTTNFILSQREELESLRPPRPAAERWAGTRAHDIPAADAATGSYEAAGREAGDEPATEQEEEPTDTTDPEDYMAAIIATINRMHTRQSEFMEITEQHSHILSLVEHARHEGHNLIVGLRHFQDTPGITGEQIEFETDHVRRQLRELYGVVEHYEESFEN